MIAAPGRVDLAPEPDLAVASRAPLLHLSRGSKAPAVILPRAQDSESQEDSALIQLRRTAVQGKDFASEFGSAAMRIGRC